MLLKQINNFNHVDKWKIQEWSASEKQGAIILLEGNWKCLMKSRPISPEKNNSHSAVKLAIATKRLGPRALPALQILSATGKAGKGTTLPSPQPVSASGCRAPPWLLSPGPCA